MTPGDDSDDLSFECQCDDGTPSSIAIIRAVCAIEGVDPVDAPTEMDFTLHDHIDPEALDRIVTGAGANESVRVSFTINDYRVSVAGNGRIEIRSRE